MVRSCFLLTVPISKLPTVLFMVLRLVLKRLVHILSATVVSPRFSRCRMVPMPVLVRISSEVYARCRLRIATDVVVLLLRIVCPV